MMPAGSINSWKCDDCGRLTNAIHIDDGVTPMFLACRATPGCQGTAVSAGYPPPPVPEYVANNIGWEWYRPSEKWARRKGPEMLRHVQNGGLALRERALATGSTGGES